MEINPNYNIYIIFVRFKFELDENMKHSHYVEQIPNDSVIFQDFISRWMKKSKELHLFVNIYCIEQDNIEPSLLYLDKVALIKLGELYTL